MKSDNIYARTLTKISDFKFDKKVTDVFPDMISRSVPGYNSILSMFGTFGHLFVKPGTLCYDLGCSLGAATYALSGGIKHKNYKIFAVDNSADMIKQCQKVLSQNMKRINFNCILADIRDIKIKNASVVILNFTLQFINKSARTDLINHIFHGLNSGGVLLISEKIHFNDNKESDMQTEFHHVFKKLNGYSDLEISQKRSALEKVLIPESESAHFERLYQAGFAQVYTWFQCFNFISLIAVK